MLTFFRSFFKTKVGLAIVLAFLGLIGFAFASMDVSSTGTFGGIAGGDSVAVVGNRKISTAELTEAVNDALREARREDPSATAETLLANGGLERILDGLIDRTALIEWSEKSGFRAGTNLINSEIRQIPAARGPSGDFSTESYNLFLRTNGLTDARVRDQIRTTLMFQQAVLPAVYGAQLPDSIARTYARSFKERRRGAIATISSSQFAPTDQPTDQQLNAFYSENRTRFVRPERRVIRYAIFDSTTLGDSIEPTAEEIRAKYRADAATYAARELRSFSQLIAPTKEGAEAIAARVRGGQSLAQAAASAGFSTTELAGQTQSQIRSAAGADVADAYFAAAEGSITNPARSSLGWHLARVSTVDRQPARTLDQVREQIADSLREEKRQRGIAEFAVGLEDRLADGTSLTAIAQELDLDLRTTRPLTAAGRVYGTNEITPQELATILETAFEVEEGEPEIGALPDQQSFIVYEAAQVTPSAVAPLSEIRENVIAEWRRVRGNERAEAAAARIVARVEKGQDLAQAVAAEKVRLRAPEQVTYSRQELAQLQNARVPAPVALLFSMAANSVKKLEGGRDQGWYVVELESIVLEDLEEGDPLIGQARAQVGQAWSNEYGIQLIAAMRRELGVERNQSAIAAVRRQLLGEPN